MSANPPLGFLCDSRNLDSLQPGHTLLYDYRLPEYTNPADRTKKLPDTFRVVQWNVERGAKLDGIVRALKACEADLVCLQELDIHCHRSGYVNTPLELAKALHMQCVFVCEFEELDSEERSAMNAVGPRSATATQEEGNKKHREGGETHCTKHFHGNAVLSRGADLSGEVRVIRHSGSFAWEVEGGPLKEPRRGFRSALRVTVNPADRTHPAMPPLYIYCCHLEVFCGALERVRQLADCLSDAKALLRKAATGAATSAASACVPSFLIAGDLNTMAHGIVRLSPKYARDRLRILSLGETEAMWLQRKVLSRNISSAGVVRGCCPFSYRFPSYLLQRMYAAVFDSYPLWRVGYGFSREDIEAMDNTEVCFYDPGDKYSSITLDNPQYNGFVRGKLDWLLLSNLTPRPFRVARGGARPVDVATLIEMGSLDPTGYSAAYLNRIYRPDPKTLSRYPTDESRELQEADLKRCTPRDGYLFFNENYKESDHKGLLMTVRQSGLTSSPAETYPPYGAAYTSNLYALGAFLLSRVVPLAVVAGAGLTVYRHVRSR